MKRGEKEDSSETYPYFYFTLDVSEDSDYKKGEKQNMKGEGKEESDRNKV